jgi:hypothetical protein
LATAPMMMRITPKMIIVPPVFSNTTSVRLRD